MAGPRVRLWYLGDSRKGDVISQQDPQHDSWPTVAARPNPARQRWA